MQKHTVVQLSTFVLKVEHRNAGNKPQQQRGKRCPEEIGLVRLKNKDNSIH